MDLVFRLAIVLVVGVALVRFADGWQRRRPRSRTRLPQGIAMVVTPRCRLCDALQRQLEDLDVSYTMVQADDPRLGNLSVRAAPALLRIDQRGEIETMRTGRAALEEMTDVIHASPARERRAV